MASAISEGGWTVRFSRVRTETPLAGRMLVLLQGEWGSWKVEKQEEETEPRWKRVERRERERERKREGGHLAIKNTY